eukprot:362430-Chlamydomonas_euryale.AAC.12
MRPPTSSSARRVARLRVLVAVAAQQPGAALRAAGALPCQARHRPLETPPSAPPAAEHRLPPSRAAPPAAPQRCLLSVRCQTAGVPPRRPGCVGAHAQEGWSASRRAPGLSRCTHHPPRRRRGARPPLKTTTAASPACWRGRQESTCASLATPAPPQSALAAAAAANEAPAPAAPAD